MKYEEIAYKLNVTEKESNIHIANEIFADLINKFDELYQEDLKKNYTTSFNLDSGEGKKPRSKRKGASSNHIAFAYSYNYLITYLYRYAKYGQSFFNTKLINQILGYAPNYQDGNFIIKKGGLLEQLNYTTTTTDYPIAWSFEESIMDENDDVMGVSFDMFSEEENDEYKQVTLKHKGRNHKIKHPTKAFWRTPESKLEDKLDGTFYKVADTHSIPFEVFMYCMSNKEIGCKGFYLYSYLLFKNQWFGEGYDVSFENLERETGLRGRTMGDVLDTIRKYNMVTGVQNMEYYCVIIKDELKLANTYITNSFDEFNDEPLPYKKITVMKKKDYQEILDKETEEEALRLGEIITIPLDMLPY